MSNREYAHFTLVVYYKAPIAAKKGRNKQTFRDDLCIFNYKEKGVAVDHLHPIAALLMYFEEFKYQFEQAYIYDNFKLRVGDGSNQVIFKITLRSGKEQINKDLRNDYYDASTGIAYDAPINKHPNLNL